MATPCARSTWVSELKRRKHFFQMLIISSERRYGNSTKPIDATSGPRGHSKREMGKDILAAVDKIFGPNAKFIPYGYGRGGRVAYRLAFDYPERVVGVAVLDIIPTIQMLETMSLQEFHHRDTIKHFHWVRDLFCLHPSFAQVLGRIFAPFLNLG